MWIFSSFNLISFNLAAAAHAYVSYWPPRFILGTISALGDVVFIWFYFKKRNFKKKLKEKTLKEKLRNQTEQDKNKMKQIESKDKINKIKKWKNKAKMTKWNK